MQQEKTGVFIQTLRKEQGKTQRELAEQIGVSDKTVSKWETGKGFPDISNLDLLCEALGISINELLSGERLSDSSYPEKAEENIMDLIQENEKHKKGTMLQIIAGASLFLLAILILFYVPTISIGDYFDMVSLAEWFLISFAVTLAGGKKNLRGMLLIFQKAAIPAGVFVSLLYLISVFSVTDPMSEFIAKLITSALSSFYGVLAYLLLIPVKGRVE